MARSITTCTGVVINVGDKVRTETGRVITVEGAAVGPHILRMLKAAPKGKRFYNAEACTLMPADTPTTADTDPSFAEPATRAADDTDCVIWGS